MIIEETKTIYTVYKLVLNEIEVGFIEVILNENLIEITDLLIFKEYRKNGYSKILINYLFTKKEYEKIILEVKETNKIAVSLYEKYLFKKINIRKNYYDDLTDALVMEAKI